jgi:adenylylsulfate kinase
MKRAVFIGRWSPFHKGHLAIMQKKIDQNIPLLILVRDTHYDLYPPLLRKRMIETTMAKLKVDAKVMIIDDIESVNWGRGVGYEVNEIEVPDNIKRISATQVREMIQNKDNSWKESMPKGADKVLEEYLSDTGIVIWFTGLPKSGKSTITRLVSHELENRGIRNQVLDSKLMRSTVSKELGFSKEDRLINLKRAADIAKMLARNRAVVLASFITPYESQREEIRKKMDKNGSYVEVYVKASIESCRKRDDQGLYQKADQGKIKHFTGVSDNYDIPKNPDLILDTENKSPQECAKAVVEYIESIR